MKHTCLFMQHMKVFSIIWRCHLEGSFLLVVASLPFSLFFVVKVVQVKHLEYVWIWWKLQNHNFSKKKFLKHVNDVFLVTDEFWIKWFFQKNVIFCQKNYFFWEKWLFLPRAQQYTATLSRNFIALHSKKFQTQFFTHFWQLFVKRSLKNDFFDINPIT